MTRSILLLLLLMLSACASFDRTNILPGQRVAGLGFSFTVPTQNSWFAVEYGTSNRIKLSQLNKQDHYSIVISLNRGPAQGMYRNAEAHLSTLQRHKQAKTKKDGYIQLAHKEWIDSRYGKLCVRYTSSAEDWTGRNNKGPAMVDSIALTCEHPEISNVLISVEISRRYEVDADISDLTAYADALFSSLEYQSIN